MKKKINYLVLLRQYEILIASGAVLLLILFLVFNMLLPNLARANQIYAQGQTLRKKLEILKKKDSALSSLDYEFYKDVFLKSSQILPENKDYVSLIGTFDLLEKQSGVTILRTDFQLGVVSTSSATFLRAGGTPAFVIPVSIEVLGDFSTIAKFLKLVDSLAGRLMIFDDVTVSSKPGSGLDAVFNGRAFFYPLPTTLGPIESPIPTLEKDQEAILTKVSQISLPVESATELEKGSIGKKNLFE